MPNVATVNIVNDQWYCVEVHVRADSTPGVGDGLTEAYVNGTQTLSYPNRIIRDGPSLYGLSRQYTQYGTGTRWIDDLAVGNTRIGCMGAGPAPTPPVGVSAR